MRVLNLHDRTMLPDEIADTVECLEVFRHAGTDVRLVRCQRQKSMRWSVLTFFFLSERGEADFASDCIEVFPFEVQFQLKVRSYNSRLRFHSHSHICSLSA